MRLSVLINLVAVLQISATTFSQATRVSLDLKEVDIRDAFREIERNSGMSFLYYEKATDFKKTITISAKNRLVVDLLDDLLKDTQLSYKILNDKFIVISQVETQGLRISGIVTDANTGEPLPGVNIVVEGTSKGCISDENGKFSIEVPDQNSILIFSSIGYMVERVQVTNQASISVSLIPDIKQLQEVVVTAMGIKRDKKALSYSSQQISQEEITKGNNINFVNSLSGRAAGIDLLQSNSGAGGSTKVILRGSKSFLGTSQPLFVIDGIPMANLQTQDPTGFFNGRDNGDGLSNINPDDIESINILKGANAAILYGSQGSNGVVIITTKKGSNGKTKVEISSGVTFQSVSILPELQTTYGQTSTGSTDSWGEKGSYSDPVKGFFSTGVDLVNSISISGGNEKTTAYLSYSNTYSQGVIPTNQFNKHNITFSQKSTFFKNFSVSSNIMLSDQKIENKVLNGYYFNPLTGLYLFPRGLDINTYKDNYQYLNADRNLMFQNWISDVDYQQNPWWILNNNKNVETTKRLIANIDVEYTFFDGLSVRIRGNYDYCPQVWDQRIKAGTQSTLAPDNGRWIYSNTTSTQQYVDLILTYNKDFGSFDLNSVLGTNYQKRSIGIGENIDTDRSGLILPNEFMYNNVNLSTWNGGLSSTAYSRDIKESIFANLSIGYKRMLYLDLSARNEWSSTLANTSHYNYFYPSVGLSALIHEMIALPKAISFAKLRTSYSYVGKELPPFLTIPENEVSAQKGLVYNPQVPLGTLKPEMQKSLELGAELKFLDNKLGIEATYYNINNDDVFLPIIPPSGSGYTIVYVNAGRINNKGSEITISVIPVRNSNISWKSDINFSQNKNKIVKLDPSYKDGIYTPEGGGDAFDMKYKEGGSIGDIYVNSFLRDDKGSLVLDDNNIPIRNQEGTQYIGSANPKFALGWNNNISIKNISLSFLIDGKFGGKFVDATQAWFDQFGVSKRSADARDAGGVQVVGVKQDGTPVTATIAAVDYYKGIGGRGNILEQYVYDATNVRLRQVSLTYYLNMSKYHLLFNNASFSLIGQNLFFFFLEAPFDPDRTISTNSNNSQAVASFNLPPTKSYGFNIKLNF